MSGNDNLEDELRVIQEETEKAREQLAIQERKLMMPIWEKRREIVKKIPNFYATAVSKIKSIPNLEKKVLRAL